MHLHSQLGNNSRIETFKVYRLPLSTIGTWFIKKWNISIWLPIVKSLSFNNVIHSIQISTISKSRFQIYEENISKIKRMMCGLKKDDIKILTQTKIYCGITTNTHQSIRSYCKDRNDQSFSKKNRPFVIINEY